MNKINFYPQNYFQKNIIRNITPTIKSTNKSIDNFHIPKHNISIEFSPKKKTSKKKKYKK